MSASLSKKPLRIAMVAGEASGDILGAGLIKALKKKHPDAIFDGIGGPLMIAEGFQSRHPMERLSVMGLVEVLGRIFELLNIRKDLYQHYINNPPDAFIGIDAPDFNLALEKKLRDENIKTAHYVSPSVWAWRQKRIFKIAKSIDLMLCLFPFEAKFYKEHNVPVRFVGHTLADEIPLVTPQTDARKLLGYESDAQIVALLPGSRGGEVSKLAPLFLETAALCLKKNPALQFIIPAANEERKQQLEEILIEYKSLPVKLVLGNSRQVMSSSDAILIASGTATLEAMLIKRPMVVSYKVNSLTAMIAKRLLTQPFVSLPNLLAGKELVPEILQDDATAENLCEAVMQRLGNSDAMDQLQATYTDIHKNLQRDADEQSAEALLALIDGTL
jgi:lipid-A-disaccharide synthase